MPAVIDWLDYIRYRALLVEANHLMKDIPAADPMMGAAFWWAGERALCPWWTGGCPS